jgi:MoaA/NifB/PqqE/SkfB family radical SAM enzyme
MIECKNLTNGLRIATAGTYFTCCHTFNNPYKDENGKEMLASTHTIEDALKSPTRLKMLDDFKNDIRHPACVVCWSGEDAGFVSKRQRDNDTYSQVLEVFPERKDSDLFFLELNLGNTCNLACRICHISASSKWKEFHHVTETGISDEHLNDYVVKYSKAFKDESIVWEELMKILPEVRSLDIYGGEPMLMKKQWEILEMSVRLGHSKKQQMSFNTNGTIINEKYIEILSSFEQCRIGFSIDGVGERFNYLRHFGVWDVVKENIKTWQNKVKETRNEKINFEVCCTISILNVLYVFEMVDFVIENQLKLMVAFVYNPLHLHIGSIPEEYKKIIINKLESEYEFRVNEINNSLMLNEGEKFYRRSILRQAEKVINTLKLPVDYKPIYWTEFRRQTIELDILRNQSFADTFPELEEIYNITKIIKPNIEQKKLI